MERNDYGSRINEVRLFYHLTLEQFAQEFHVSPEDIISFESTDVMPPDHFFQDLSKITGISYLWLKTGEGKKRIRQTRSELLDEIDRLIGKMDELTELTLKIRDGNIYDWNLNPYMTLVSQGKTEPENEK